LTIACASARMSSGPEEGAHATASGTPVPARWNGPKSCSGKDLSSLSRAVPRGTGFELLVPASSIQTPSAGTSAAPRTCAGGRQGKRWGGSRVGTRVGSLLSIDPVPDPRNHGCRPTMRMDPETRLGSSATDKADGGSSSCGSIPQAGLASPRACRSRNVGRGFEGGESALEPGCTARLPT
jgi:hypothetical protein